MRRVDIDPLEELKAEPVKAEKPVIENTTIEPPKNPFKELEKEKYRSPLAEKIEDDVLSTPDSENFTNSEAKFEKAEVKPATIPIIEPKKLEEHAIPVAKTSPSLGPEWIRQELPSHCVPYDFTEIFLRPLTFKMLGKIHAANINKSYTMLLDALGNCISEDIRDLTPEDLTFIMYWIRDNSYPQSPLKFRYTTHYGNEIEYSVRKSNLEIVELSMTKEEYLVYKNQGLCFPTVRDAELLFGDSVDPDVRYLLEYAQYINIKPTEDEEIEEDYESYAQRKIDKIENELGLAILPVIDDFSTKISHGVKESVKIKDTKFKPEEAIVFLRNRALEVRERIVSIPSVTHSSEFDETVTMFLNLADELETEANEIKEKLDRGEKPQPREEVVEVSISSTDFFPSL